MIHSIALEAQVRTSLKLGWSRGIDGFVLLRNSSVLQALLDSLRAEMNKYKTRRLRMNSSLIRDEAELSLLVEGFIEDDQVFKSFGYEDLYEQGFLSYDLWKAFQTHQTFRTLDQLDAAFYTAEQIDGPYPCPKLKEKYSKYFRSTALRVSMHKELAKDSSYCGNTPWLNTLWFNTPWVTTSLLNTPLYNRHEYYVPSKFNENPVAVARRKDRPNDPQREECIDAIKMRSLHIEFRKVHKHVLACARAPSPTKWSSLPHGPFEYSNWGNAFDDDYSKAWSRGMSVMRGLCRGEVPSNLYDTIMFLAIARAISLIKSASGASAQHTEFVADLSRWQVLFVSEDSALSNFRHAVSDIWGASIEDLDRVQSPHSTGLVYFRELAMSMISYMKSSGDHLGHSGMATQEWRQQEIVPETFEAKRPEPFGMQFPENLVERGGFVESPKSDPKIVEPSHNFGYHASPLLMDAVRDDARKWNCNEKVVLLMASFAFICFVAFLRGWFPWSGLLPTIVLMVCMISVTGRETPTDSVDITKI